jgi:VWFA-related protein
MRRISILSAIAVASVAFLIRAQEPADSGAIIRTETRVVLVDAVVTDKKGGYVHDLTAKDFKVFEDNKEQKITSFSFEADPASPLNSEPRYLVLFFDNSTMDLNDQAVARKAATQFITANAGPTRQMAIVNFGGSLQIAQNFTGDVERLKAVVSGIKTSVTTTMATGSGPMAQISRAEAGFGQRDSILALRSLAKSLAGVRGRKTLILLTAGFPLNEELMAEVTAAIDASNRSNVAIYPIDVRGLVASDGGHDDDAMLLHTPGKASPFTPAVYVPGSVMFLPVQTSTGGGTRTGGASGSGAGGTRAPTGTSGSGPTRTGSTGSSGSTKSVAAAGLPMNSNMTNAARVLVPPFPKDALTNQQVMYMLAEGTGGFVILNTNDLVGGMDKISKELNEYYLLGYSPQESKEGSCHALRVKLDKSGVNVRARTGFCNAKSNDVLAQNPAEKTLENRAAAQQPGNVAAALEVPFFFTAPNLARVNVAMEISTDSLKFEKDKGKLHAAIDVLGIAARQDGSVGARFTDTVHLDFESKKDLDAFKAKPYHYENQFDIAAGAYMMKVAFSSGGDSFGKVERPLVVDAYDGTGFALSPIAFSTSYAPAESAGSALDVALLDDRTPLVVMGLHLTPSGTNKFKASEKPIVYFEVYEPELLNSTRQKPVVVGLQVRVLERASGAQKADSGGYRIPIPDKPTSPVIPWGAKIPIEELKPGAYFVVIDAMDSAGRNKVRTAEFVIE